MISPQGETQETSGEKGELTKEGIISGYYQGIGELQAFKGKLMAQTMSSLEEINEGKVGLEAKALAQAITEAEGNVYNAVLRQEEALRATGRTQEADEIHQTLFGGSMGLEGEDQVREDKKIEARIRQISDEAREK